jgi:hypothetical protein
MCEIWGRGHFVCVLKFDSHLPEDHRFNTLSKADSLRHHCKLGGGLRLDPRHQCLPEVEVGHSRIVLPPETGEQPSLSVCVFITAVPITKLFVWGEGDSGGHVLLLLSLYLVTVPEPQCQ